MPNILIVDDDARYCDALSSELSQNGYRTIAASSVSEATTQLEQKAFDLVLTEIKFPEENGSAFVKLARKNLKIKVIVLTDYADLKNAIEAKKAGADDFLSKPYDLMDLLDTIERVLTGT